MDNKKLNKNIPSGFKVPKGYFDSFEDKLMEQLKSESTFEVSEPGFKVPENYLDSIENSVFEKLNEKKETPVISIFRSKKLYFISGIAASLLLLFAVFINSSNTTEELSFEMVENYFINSDLDTYELAELLTDVEILVEDFSIAEIDYKEENLEDYLIDNADIELILE